MKFLKVLLFIAVFAVFIFIFFELFSYLDKNQIHIDVSDKNSWVCQAGYCTPDQITGFPFADTQVISSLQVEFTGKATNKWENLDLMILVAISLAGAIPTFVVINKYWNKKISQKENSPQGPQPTG